MSLLMQFYSAMLTKCSTEGSLLQRKKEVIVLTILKRGRKHKMSYKSVTQALYHKTCVLCQIPLSTTHVVHYGVLTVHASNTPFPVTRH
jgi:hypothetical protein